MATFFLTTKSSYAINIYVSNKAYIFLNPEPNGGNYD